MAEMTAVAHTLPYDFAVLNDDDIDSPVAAAQLAAVSIPTLLLAGERSNLREAALAVAAVVPSAQHRVLPRQRHLFRPKAVAPALVELFAHANHTGMLERREDT